MPRKKSIIIPHAIVIYTRVSTDEQGKSGLGIEAQLNLCRQYAKNYGKEIIAEFQEVTSGKTELLEREQFTQAVMVAQSNGASLVVGKLDRLSRVLDDVSGYVSKRIFGLLTPPLIVAENPNASELEINLRAVVAQEERRMISERTKAALARKKKQGFELGKGGREAHSAKAQSLTKDAIATALELKAKGLSLQAIADTLNEEGYTTSRGTQWSKQALHKRLKAA